VAASSLTAGVGRLACNLPVSGEEGPMSDENRQSEIPAEATQGAAPRPVEEVVFVLRYDEELTFLVNEGVLRPGLLPSALK
jgi:hypothetical protein